MSTTTNETYGDRLLALEATLARRGRDDLLAPLRSLRASLAAISDATPPEARRALDDVARRTLGAIREAVSDPRRSIPLALLEDLERVALRIEADVTDGWADGVLVGLGDADDAELETLAAAVRSIARVAPKDDLGTLREPLNQKPAGGGAPPRVLMKGELHPGLLADLIQLFAQNCETGSLLIEGKGASASVFFKNGMIVDAVCGEDTGEKGFFRAMHVREGRFSYQRGVEADEVRIYRTAQHLIMDTLRMIDEAS